MEKQGYESNLTGTMYFIETLRTYHLVFSLGGESMTYLIFKILAEQIILYLLSKIND